jgi:hypothetical protein
VTSLEVGKRGVDQDVVTTIGNEPFVPESIGHRGAKMRPPASHHLAVLFAVLLRDAPVARKRFGGRYPQGKEEPAGGEK